MHLRKILMDGPIGKVFTNTEKTSTATAANLIAGDRLKRFLSPSTTVTYPSVGEYYINIQAYQTGISRDMRNFSPAVSYGGIITNFTITLTGSPINLIDLYFYNRATQAYRRVVNPNPTVAPAGISSYNLNNYYTVPGSWFTYGTYSNLAISFGADECLVIRVVKKSYTSSTGVKFNIGYYLGNLGS